jgi:uncharacterized protein
VTVNIAPGIGQRLAECDWPSIQQALHDHAYALTPALLTGPECDALREMYALPWGFRSHIIMARYRFGRGDYKYFNYPLPGIVQELREKSYPHLVPVANAWNANLGAVGRFPPSHADFLAACKQAGQTRATPLLLHYEAGDFNCLHQDLYGAVAFPLQMTCFLSRPGADYEGGEFVLVEQQPRAQSRARVIAAGQGQILIFATRYRPVKGSRGFYRTNLRHGVSEVRRGVRFTLGVIYHDAE